jgi:putative hydrolase of the HAD superfamily
MPMDPVKAIGFDLFNTLIMAQPGALDEAMSRLVGALVREGFSIEPGPFRKVYRDAALHFIEETRKDGRETHNRFWISAALEKAGYSVAPDDPRIASGIDAYFAAFLDFCHVIPETLPMLEKLKPAYRLGLLSNFTHAPAALKLIDHLGLTGFFDVILISGEMGFRKPHPLVFEKLTDSLGVGGKEILYVGDDAEADIAGALGAGIQPVWFTYARDRGSPLPPGAGSEPVKIPDRSVPEISTWEELFSLMNSPRGLMPPGP